MDVLRTFAYGTAIVVIDIIVRPLFWLLHEPTRRRSSGNVR